MVSYLVKGRINFKEPFKNPSQTVFSIPNWFETYAFGEGLLS